MGDVTVFAMNAIKERKGAQPPESLLSEQNDEAGRLEMKVHPERLRSCRVTSLDRKGLWIFSADSRAN